MRVVHISTSDVGGAGRAAIRLHRGLRKEGLDSKFLCLHKQSSEEEVYQYKAKYNRNLFQRAYQKVGVFQPKGKSLQKQVQKYAGKFELFSFPYTKYNILNDSIVRDADLINLHWIADFVDYPSFFEGIDKPVVWTLHDKNPTMGGFHLLIDKERNPSMVSIEQTIEREKQSILKRFERLDIVSPSAFLLNYSKGSASLRKFRHHLIQNSIDTTVFRPHSQHLAREVFGIPIDKKVILFLASKCFHKGADVVYECLNKFQYDNVMFIGIGEATSSTDNLMHVKEIGDERLMSLLYSSADLFLLPSREDNLPNMMLEALACGTPVIGFPTGGICDVIEHGFTGLVTEDQSSSALNKEINCYLDNPGIFRRDRIRDFALENIDIEIQAKRYKQLYSSVFDNIICG